ncbi:diaminopimelate decarboxylase [archaeon]|nr:diaminopimelate decarboxylase [archaeon]
MWWENKGHLTIKDNELIIGELKATEIAKEFDTPIYVYNKQRILDNFNTLKNAFEKHTNNFRIHYAMKANSNLTILKMLSEQGAYIDAVSPLEAKIAIRAGFTNDHVMFTGTSVSDEDLKQLLDMDVFLNIDSISQLKRLRKLTDKKLNISIRWNPGEGAGHHANTITAGKYIKFGIPEHKINEAIEEIKTAGFNLVGLHQHIGSGWLEDDVPIFLESVDKTITTAKNIENKLGKKLKFIDFGGGPGIPYNENENPFPVETYATGICQKIKESNMDVQIAIEPGRFIVGDAGILLTEINTVEEKNIPVIGINAGFNTLARPAMYGSHHEIVIADNVESKNKKEYMVAGNLCESGDVFTKNKKTLRLLPTPKEKNIIAILNAGAYGFSMASTYNSRPLPKEILIDKNNTQIIRRQQTIEDLLREQE